LTAALLVIGVIAVPRAIRRGAERILISRTYATQTAQRATVTLDDGSTVVLAPESRVCFTLNGMGRRSVDLVGEALFTVTQRPDHPFVVRTGAVSTRVLGTAFDVRRYAADTATLVTVLSGRVASGGSARPVVLTAGRIGRITDSTAVVSATPNPAHAVLWTQGRLEFNDTPVPAMLATLGRWYGYEFRLADTTLATRYVSVGFKTDRVEETMSTLKALLGVTMTFEGKVVTLHLEHAWHNTPRSTRNREFPGNSSSEVGK